MYIYIYLSIIMVRARAPPGFYQAAVPATATFHAGERTFFRYQTSPRNVPVT